MSIKTIVVVLLAVACGISAAWGMSQLRNTSIVEVQADTTPVVVAEVTIPRGQMATAENVTLQHWPKRIVPEGVLTKLEDAIDRPAIFPVMAGEPVFDAKLASKEGGRGLAILIPKGMRAYTIQASRETANVAGFILPGNRVDVLLTLKGRPNDETGGGSTTTLLQAVEILAVGQQLDAPAENQTDPASLRSVTLLVTPQQASLLDLGQHMGQLTLSLRNPMDREEAQTHPATLADIRFRQESPTEEPSSGEAPQVVVHRQGRRPASFQILTLRGSRRGSVRVTAAE